MLTPSIFKRGLIWLLFFIFTLFAAPFFAEEEPAPTRTTTNSVNPSQ